MSFDFFLIRWVNLGILFYCLLFLNFDFISIGYFVRFNIKCVYYIKRYNILLRIIKGNLNRLRIKLCFCIG